MIWWNNCKDPTLCCPLYHCGQGFWDRKTFLLEKHHLLVAHFFSTSCYQRKVPFWELFFVYYFTTPIPRQSSKTSHPLRHKRGIHKCISTKTHIIRIQHRPHQSKKHPSRLTNRTWKMMVFGKMFCFLSQGVVFSGPDLGTLWGSLSSCHSA